jgi:hypothetical protein
MPLGLHDEVHLHEGLVKAHLAMGRPPAIHQQLDRVEEGNPASDQEAFPQYSLQQGR